MLRVDRHHEGVLSIFLTEVLGDVLGMGEIVVHANERGGDVGLLVEMGEAEAGDCRLVVEDRGLVLRAEARGEGVACLC